MSELLFADFQSYIKTLCVKHKQLMHDDAANVSFVRMHSEDDLNKIKTIGSPVLVIVDTFTGRRIGEPESRMLQQHASLAFVAKAVANTGDPSGEIENAQKKAMEIMMDFLARMEKDQQDDDCGVLQYLVSEQMTFSPVDGPVLEAHYGWEMDIPFSTTAPPYDANKWNP